MHRCHSKNEARPEERRWGSALSDCSAENRNETECGKKGGGGGQVERRRGQKRTRERENQRKTEREREKIDSHTNREKVRRENDDESGERHMWMESMSGKGDLCCLKLRYLSQWMRVLSHNLFTATVSLDRKAIGCKVHWRYSHEWTWGKRTRESFLLLSMSLYSLKLVCLHFHSQVPRRVLDKYMLKLHCVTWCTAQGKWSESRKRWDKAETSTITKK